MTTPAGTVWPSLSRRAEKLFRSALCPPKVTTFACAWQYARDRHTYPEAIRAMNHEDLKDPETLIGRMPESKKVRLKMYLGGAAGVE